MRAILLKPAVLVLAIVALCATGCQRSRPNVLVVTFDTTRADSVGYVSGREDVTPALDRLAAGGTWFATALASQPLTLPSHSTIFTGNYPPKHGARNNGSHVLAPENFTLAEKLRDAGYETRAIVSSFVLDSRFGLDQGFDVYDDDLTAGQTTRRPLDRELPANVIADKAIAWVRDRQDPKRPFFLWLHFYDPHDPYEPPENIRSQFPTEPYLGEIHFADRELSRVLDELRDSGLLENTIVAAGGDHGEAFGEHGEMTHGVFIYESTTRVPLLFAGPGVPAGKRVDDVVRTADLAPTIVELLGLPGLGDIDGRSLVPLWSGQSDSRIAYMESFLPRLDFGWSELRGLRSAKTKVIRAPKPEIYDLATDRNESRNLYSDDPPSESRRLLSELRSIEEADPFSRGEHSGVALDRETRERLAALGYIGGGDVSSHSERADPKDRIDFWESYRRAQELARNGDHEKAVAGLEQLLSEDPESVTVLSRLASSLSRLGRIDETLEILRRIYSLDPSRISVLTTAAELHRKRGEFDEAELLVRSAIEAQPRNPEGYVGLAELHISRREYENAERVLREALDIEPSSPDLLAVLGSVLDRQGKLEQSATLLRATLDRYPDHHRATYNLAVVVEKSGDASAARELYRKAVRLDPEDSRSWNNLGANLDRAGERQKAIRAIAIGVSLDPSNVEATFNLGALLVEANRFEDALRLLDRAAVMRPRQPLTRYYRARAMDGLGRTSDANEEYLAAALAATARGNHRLAQQIVNLLLENDRIPRSRIARLAPLGRFL